MLAGLMGATVLGGIAPAYAQNEPRDRGNRAERPDGGQRGGGNWQRDPNRGAAQGQRWQQPQRAERPAMPQGRPVQAQAPNDRMMPPRNDQQWRGDRNRVVTPSPTQQGAQRDWRNDRRDGRQDAQQGLRDDRQDWRQNGRQDQRADRQDWRQDRRDDNRDDRRNTQRWNDNRNWNGNDRNDNRWNNSSRYDDRTRWSTQRRWDNGWRQDRRYDWSSYRNRYGDRYRAGRYYAPRGWDYGYRRFSVGFVLSNVLYSNSYWLNDPYAYRLPPAYGTLRWVRYYDDALLVDIRDGYVVDVIHDFFW